MLMIGLWIRADHAAAAAGMDAFDLFRKLGAGAKFDLKRFGEDAARFKVKSTYARCARAVTLTNVLARVLAECT